MGISEATDVVARVTTAKSPKNNQLNTMVKRGYSVAIGSEDQNSLQEILMVEEAEVQVVLERLKCQVIHTQIVH